MFSLFVLCVLAAIIIAWCHHRREMRASDDAQWDCPDGAALKAFATAMEPEYRHERWQARFEPWRTPWPWWFLGACLAFAGLCLGVGLWQWRSPDAPVLLVGGLVFGLAAAFKAWMQAPAAPAQPHVPPAQRWHSRSRA